jgi:hypothetical protein
MKKLSKINNVFIFLFFLGFKMAYGQSGHGPKPTHKNYNELEQGYKQCENMIEPDKYTCFQKLFRECSATAFYCRQRYGLREGNLPEQCGEVISLRLKVLSKANSLKSNK